MTPHPSIYDLGFTKGLHRVDDVLAETLGGRVPLGARSNARLANPFTEIIPAEAVVRSSAWTPTWDTNGAGTISAAALSTVEYFQIDGHVWFTIDATVTIASADAATTAIRFTMPVPTDAPAHTFHALVKDPNSDLLHEAGYAYHIHSSAPNKVYVFRVTNSGNAVTTHKAWTSGINREVWVSGFYKVE
jgi:hypothetical protein